MTNGSTSRAASAAPVPHLDEAHDQKDRDNDEGAEKKVPNPLANGLKTHLVDPVDKPLQPIEDLQRMQSDCGEDKPDDKRQDQKPDEDPERCVTEKLVQACGHCANP